MLGSSLAAFAAAGASGLVHSASSSHPPPPLSPQELQTLNGQAVTLVGFGSLLSETSSRTTFPTLENFRLGRVQGFRRVFRHPAAIFWERGIARPETREVSSLSVEPVDDLGVGFVCSLFDIEDFQVQDFVDREEEFAFCLAPFKELGRGETRAGGGTTGRGLMCVATHDAAVEARWGGGYIERKYGVHGVTSIWEGWDDILPCPVYLRHCVLAAEKQGPECHASFLTETFLSDRKTTIEEHLRRRPDIMETLPPPSVANRYTG